MNYNVLPQRPAAVFQNDEIPDFASMTRQMNRFESKLDKIIAFTDKASFDSSSKDPECYLVVELALGRRLEAVVVENLEHLRRGVLTKKKCTIQIISYKY